MKKGELVKGYLFVIVSAVIYGCMPLMATHIYADGVNPMTLVFLRNFLSLPALAALALWQQKTLKVPKATLGPVSLLALFGCCVTPVLLFSSYRYIPSGTATVPPPAAPAASRAFWIAAVHVSPGLAPKSRMSRVAACAANAAMHAAAASAALVMVQCFMRPLYHAARRISTAALRRRAAP